MVWLWLKIVVVLDTAEKTVGRGTRNRRNEGNHKVDMAYRLRSMKEDEFDLGQVFDRMVKGMRNEMNTVLWKIERSRDMSPEALKIMIRNGLESMVGAVEKVMSGVSDGIVKERKEREREDMQKEERVRKLEERIDKELRDRAGNVKESEDRLKILDSDRKILENGVKELAEKMDKERKVTEEETIQLKVSDGELKESIVEEKKVRESEDRKLLERNKGIEASLAKERKYREELEKEIEMDKKMNEVMESEKEMERKVEEAMEQIKILDLDFGDDRKERKMLVEEAVKIIKEKVDTQDREECDRIFKGTKVYILGKITSQKQTQTGEIYTVPVLLACQCRSKKERLEEILRRARLHIAFQWPKESLEFVNGVREEVEKTGYERKAYFTRLRPTSVDGRVMIRADCRSKEGGKFEQVACWRLPPLDRTKWECLNGIMKPETPSGKDNWEK